MPSVGSSIVMVVWTSLYCLKEADLSRKSVNIIDDRLILNLKQIIKRNLARSKYQENLN